jgi:hypothetical protein
MNVNKIKEKWVELREISNVTMFEHGRLMRCRSHLAHEFMFDTGNILVHLLDLD